MKPFGADATVTVEQYKEIQQQVVITARRTLIGRKIIGASPPAGLGVQTFSYDKLTEMADAELAYDFVESLDSISLARTNVDVPILSRGFHIKERDLLSSKRTGQPLDSASVSSAAYKVALLEDALLLKGHTNYSISGLYDGAGNAEATAADFATFGKPTTKIELAIELMETDNISGPYNLVLNGIQAVQLKASISSTGVRELPIVQDLLDGGTIFKTPTQTAGAGMLVSADGVARGEFEYKLAADFTTALKRLHIVDGGGLKGRVYLAGVPVIRDSNAICTLTNI